MENSKRGFYVNSYLVNKVREIHKVSVNELILNIPIQFFTSIVVSPSKQLIEKLLFKFESKEYLDIIFSDYSTDDDNNDSKQIFFSTSVHPLVKFFMDTLTNNMEKGEKIAKSRIFEFLLSIALFYNKYPEEFIKDYKLSCSALPVIYHVQGNKTNAKTQEAITKLFDELPDNITNFVEPFVGMCGITFNLLEKLNTKGGSYHYYLSDIDKDKINLLLCVKEKPKEIIIECLKILTKLKEAENEIEVFEEIKNDYSKNHSVPKNVTLSSADCKAAAMYMYINAVSVRHLNINLDKKTRIDTHINTFFELISNIFPAHKMLKSQKIKINNYEYKNALKKKNKTLFIFDPPYINTPEYKDKNGNPFPFDIKDHDTIAEFMQNANKSTICILFCRFKTTRIKKTKETKKDILRKIENGEFEIEDERLEGHYKRIYGQEAKFKGREFYYKIIPTQEFNHEVIISNYPFDGFQRI